MEKIEFFESREAMKDHYAGIKERVANAKELFKKKYEGKVDCRALFEDMRSMYIRDNGIKSLFSLMGREEYRHVNEDDFYDLVSAVSLELGQLKAERKRYAVKSSSETEKKVDALESE